MPHRGAQANTPAASFVSCYGRCVVTLGARNLIVERESIFFPPFFLSSTVAVALYVCVCVCIQLWPVCLCSIVHAEARGLFADVWKDSL